MPADVLCIVTTGLLLVSVSLPWSILREIDQNRMTTADYGAGCGAGMLLFGSVLFLFRLLAG